MANKSEARKGRANNGRAASVRATRTERAAVTPRSSAHASARAQRAADPELRELDDEAIARLDDARDRDDDLVAAARGVLAPPAGAPATRASDEEPSAELAGGDVDAAVTETGSGEEAVGGSAATPDQDSVEEQGAALGIVYQPGEPLHTTEKVARRDDQRWELNPASSEDFAERRNLGHALPERPRRRSR